MVASKKVLLCAAIAGVALWPTITQAAVSVSGKGAAKSCFEHAESGRDIETGIKHCNSALVDAPLTIRDRAATFVNRGILRIRDKNIDAAVKDYETAIRINPRLAEAYVNKGIALVYVGGRDAEAVDVITRGIELKTEQPEVAYYTRGMAYELMGNDEAAYNDYRQAAALKPDWTEPQMQLKRFSADKSG